MLFSVPRDSNNPEGVIVCSAGVVKYRHFSEEDAEGNLLPREEAGAPVTRPNRGDTSVLQNRWLPRVKNDLLQNAL